MGGGSGGDGVDSVEWVAMDGLCCEIRRFHNSRVFSDTDGR